MTAAPGTPTLDQLQVLVEIVETGSFSAAARKMNRAISVISYTISNLELQLGLTLFDRDKSRRPQLTEAGRVVLAEARLVADGVDNLRAKVKGMLQGVEGELEVALDSLVPATRVIDALKAFNTRFPTVALNLHVETLGAVAALVLEKAATIGISGPFAEEYDALTRISVGSLKMIPVAGRAHPLANPPHGGHPAGATREHVQLVIYDRSPLTCGREFNIGASRIWRLADLHAKHMLLRGGIGWGMMPDALVADDLQTGVLVQLEIPDRVPVDYPIDGIYRRDTPPGPAAAWLIERFRRQTEMSL